MRFGWFAPVALAAALAAPEPGKTPPAPGMPHFAVLTSVEGLPTDSLLARAFLSGFRGAFTEDFFSTERPRKDGAPRASPPLSNRFRLLEGASFGDEWQVRLTVLGWWRVGPGVAAPSDTSGARPSGPGCRVNLTVLSANAAELGLRPLPVREDLVFQVPLDPRPEFFAHAGRTAGLLAAEELHRQSGELAEDTTLRLERAARRAVVARRAPAPRR